MPSAFLWKEAIDHLKQLYGEVEKETNDVYIVHCTPFFHGQGTHPLFGTRWGDREEEQLCVSIRAESVDAWEGVKEKIKETCRPTWSVADSKNSNNNNCTTLLKIWPMVRTNCPHLLKPPPSRSLMSYVPFYTTLVAAAPPAAPQDEVFEPCYELRMYSPEQRVKTEMCVFGPEGALHCVHGRRDHEGKCLETAHLTEMAEINTKYMEEHEGHWSKNGPPEATHENENVNM